MLLHLDPAVETLVPAAVVVALSCGGHSPGEALRVCLPALVGCPPALDRRCAAVRDAAHAFRQCGAGCLGSDLVCGDRLIVVGDDGAGETTGVLLSSVLMPWSGATQPRRPGIGTELRDLHRGSWRCLCRCGRRPSSGWPSQCDWRQHPPRSTKLGPEAEDYFNLRSCCAIRMSRASLRKDVR